MNFITISFKPNNSGKIYRNEAYGSGGGLEKKSEIPSKDCAYARQQPLEIFGGEMIFNLYNKFIRHTAFGKLLDKANMEPAHAVMTFPGGFNIGFSAGTGVDFEQVKSNTYTDGKCLNQHELINNISKVYKDQSQYSLRKFNCQDFVENWRK